MTLTLQTIENLAPDQASLSSAKKLLSASKWQGQGFCATTHTAWGECQGSGSKPYYVVVDVADTGYKCTCPSRKFPCKHALALMWRYVDDPTPFVPAPTPDWVADWLGRRRKSKTDTTAEQPQKTTSQETKNSNTAKSIALADTPEQGAETDPKKLASAKKRAEKVKATTDAQISAGLADFVGWLDDQVRLGLGAFLDKAGERCRQISARLVDAKAGGLANLVDELPSVILSTPKADRASVVLGAFGRWYLLCQAWQKTPDDPDIRRVIIKAEDKDSLLNQADLAHIGAWQVVGEQVQTQKSGPIRSTTYLVKLADTDNPNDSDTVQNTPTTAVLLDFIHASSGSKRTTSRVGAIMAGRLIYYPSRVPFRAFFETVETTFLGASVSFYQENQTLKTPNLPPPIPIVSDKSLASAYAHRLSRLAWTDEYLHAFGAGHIGKDGQGRFWYVSNDEKIILKNKDLSQLIQSADIERAFVLWDGWAGELLSVQTNWGLLEC